MVYTITLVTILFISLLFFGSGSSIKKEKRYLLVTFLLLWILSAIRYQDVRSDFSGNYKWMILIRSIPFDSLFIYKEFLHELFRKVISILFDDPQWYFVISSFIITYIIFRFGYRYIYNLSLYIIMYYCVFSYFTFNNVTRQGISVAIMMMAYDHFIRGKKISSYLIAVIACLFHTSAVLAVVPFFLTRVKRSRKTLFVYLILTVALAIGSRPITNMLMRFLYSEYTLEQAYGTNSASLLYIVFPIMSVIFLFGYTSSTDNLEHVSIVRGRYDILNQNAVIKQRLDSLIMHGTIIYAMFMLLSCFDMLMFARFALYYVPFFALCIDKTLLQISPVKRRNIIIMLVIFSLVYFGVMNYSGKLIPTPYHTIWEFPDRPR